MRYWEIIADNLSKAGWNWGCVSAIDSNGRMLFTADAYSRNGRRFTVLSHDAINAFVELERATRDDSRRNQTAPMRAARFLKRPASTLCF